MLFFSKEKLESKLSKIRNNKYFSYGKSRISGSKNFSYFMHSRSTCMPGQNDLFTINSTTKPKEISDKNMNQFSRVYKRERYKHSIISKGNNLISSDIYEFVYDEFAPYSDESLNLAVIAAYKQIYGNINPMESEKPIEIERRLRNGDISIRDFIRALAKSDFYLDNFVNKVSQTRLTNLTFMHILGRPILNQEELINSINLIIKRGFQEHVDHLIDSSEYSKYFGESIVPFQRCWNSPYGVKTSSFVKTAFYRKGYASSDNLIYK